VPLVEYHVVPDRERWDVERDDTFTGSFAYDVHTAVGLATYAAQRHQHKGLDVMVCTPEPDGHFAKCGYDQGKRKDPKPLDILGLR
jgi:hypothetical protein